MEENVFYGSSWQKRGRSCCEPALPFSQAFCLEDQCSFPLSAATSEWSDFADFPLPSRMPPDPFSLSSCGAAAACQCKQLLAGAAAAPPATGRSSLLRGSLCQLLSGKKRMVFRSLPLRAVGRELQGESASRLVGVSATQPPTSPWVCGARST